MLVFARPLTFTLVLPGRPFGRSEGLVHTVEILGQVRGEGKWSTHDWSSIARYSRWISKVTVTRGGPRRTDWWFDKVSTSRCVVPSRRPGCPGSTAGTRAPATELLCSCRHRSSKDPSSRFFP